jgi:hypothetical protein
MGELTNIRYAVLFEVRLLHHYWLDDGALGFDTFAADKQDARLRRYDARQLFGVVPTPATADMLQRVRGLFKATALGFLAAVPADTVLAADTELAFVVTMADAALAETTALTLLPRATHQAFDPSDTTPARVVYRYKENVPVLSNLTGTARGNGPDTALFLSRDYPAPTAGDPVEALVNSGGALLQLTSGNPGAATQELDADATAATVPIYVHQADAPVVTPPAGVMGAPARGVQLSDDVADDLFMLIRLTAVRGDDDAFSFVDGNGAARVPAPVYQVRFKNRSTLWTYLDKRTGAVSATEAKPLPLTFFGNAGAGQKPSRGIVKALQSGGRITQLVSEIYI